MRNGRFVRKLAGFLAALTLLQCGAPLTALAAEQESDQIVAEVQQAATPALQNGTAIIPSDATQEQVKEILCQAMVSNADEVDAQSLEWEYYCEGKSSTGIVKNTTWGSVDGFISKSWGATCTHPALSANDDGSYQVRLVGDDGNGVTLTKTKGKTSSINLKDGPFTVSLPLNENGSVNYDDLRAAIFDAVVASTTPELNVSDVTIECQYKNVIGQNVWGVLEGDSTPVTGYAPVDEGSYTLLISYAGDNGYLPTSTQVEVTFAKKLETPVITLNKGCTVSLHSGDWTAVRQEILDKVVADNEYGLTTNNTTIQYFYKGVTSVTDAWVPLDGDTFHKAVQDNQSYKIRVIFNGSNLYESATSNEMEVRFASKSDAVISLNPLEEGTVYTAALPYTEETTVDYDLMKQEIYQAVVASTTPELAVDDVTIEYYATYQLFNQSNEVSSYEVGKAWVPLNGKEETLGRYPAISDGNQQIKISWGGNEEYYGFEEEVTVNITERPAAPYTLKETYDAVTLAVDENMQVDYDLLHDAIFSAVVDSSDVLTADNVTITYESTAKIDIGGILPKDWVALAGETKTYMNIPVDFPAISAGDQKIRIFFAGNQQYAPTTIEATITVKDREQVKFNLNEGPYEVGMVFTGDQVYDYDATAAAIYNAVVASTTNPEGLTAEDVTVEYNTDKSGLTHISYKPLDEADPTGLVKFGTGTWEIRISWAGNQEYKGGSTTATVTTTDNRLASSVALKSGVSFTYNMDVNAMKQAIFDNVIDWDNSTLPAKDTLSIEDFTIEYKAKLTDAETGLNVDLDGLLEKFPALGNLINNDTLSQYVPIEGKEYIIPGIPGVTEDTKLGQFPQMGAGENQQIRVSYKGDAEYRPSDFSEGTVTVNKAKVSVKVNSTNIYADEALPENFITLNPNDKFDLYTIYAGMTSNVTTGIYLDLPERYTDNSLIIKAIDGVLEGLGQKTLTQMMNDGVTVGELRALFNTQGVLDALEALGINTGTFGQILTVINKLPGILDSVRIAFGTPNNRAGLYTVGVITDSKNYETGVGIGFLLVKMRLSGANLTWNKAISGGNLTAEEAKTFDFGATLSYDGDPTVDQSGVHYLYSGFTSKWKIYSSTTTPPTEPGRYVVTVCILGGNYMAAPITRSFQITK